MIEFQWGDVPFAISYGTVAGMLGVLLLLGLLGLVMQFGFDMLCRFVGAAFFWMVSLGCIRIGRHSRDREALKRWDATRFFYIEDGKTYVYEEWCALTGLALLVTLVLFFQFLWRG